jgi:sarcosine oxidase
MSAATIDVAVLGVGGIGASALMHLARRGLKVVGFEQHSTATDASHDRGGSHGGTRVIRKAYGEGGAYVPLLERAYELWRELETESGTSLLHLVGCLNIGTPEHEFIRGVISSARAHHLPHEVLSGPELRARFPLFHPGRKDVAVFERDAGLLAVEDCTRAHVKVALQHGAQLRHERVISLELGPDAVTLTTEHGSFKAARVVIAAGPWWHTQPWLQELGSKLVVRRQVQCWFPPPKVERELPCFIHFVDATRSFYGLPAFGGRGPKICQHKGGAITTPDTIERQTTDADSDPVREYLRTHLPELDAAPTERKTCLYSMTPDEHFLVGVLPGKPVVALGGFSGHGFKFASVLGEIAADLLQHGRSNFELSQFDPLRFS